MSLPCLQGKVTVNFTNSKLIAKYQGKYIAMAKIDVDISLHLSAETNSYDCANDIQEQGRVGGRNDYINATMVERHCDWVKNIACGNLAVTKTF